MEQPSLFEIQTRPVEYMKDGMLHRNHGTWEERNFWGFRQTRYPGEPWEFYITGFCGPKLADGSDGVGHVLKFDGGTYPCQMDMRSRVRIDGRWYGRKHWNH
jgi:hypothetical protein